MYSINDAYIPKSVDYRTVQLQRNRRQAGSRKKLISKYDYLKPYIDCEFSDIHSSRIAQHFERYIKETNNYKKETSFFVEGIRNKILFLHNYNLKVAEITFKYPLTRNFTQLLLRYVILECNALYKREFYRPTYEAMVEQRILRLLLNIYNTCLESLMTIPPEELIKEAAKAVLKLIIRIKTEFDFHCNLLENIAKKLLTKMGELERITTLIHKFPIDTYLSDPGFINNFSDIITSDYGTDEELISRTEVDEDEVDTMNERCDSNSDNMLGIKQEMDDISSINRLYRPQINVRGKVPTIYLDDDDDVQMFLWEEEGKTSNKSSRIRKKEKNTSEQTKPCGREIQYKSFIGHTPIKSETLDIKTDNNLEVIDLASEDESSSSNNSIFNDTVDNQSTEGPIVANDVIVIDSDEDNDRLFSGSKMDTTSENPKKRDHSSIRNLTYNPKTLSGHGLHHEATTSNLEALGKYIEEIYHKDSNEELTEKVLIPHANSVADREYENAELSKEINHTSLQENRQEQERYLLTGSYSKENVESANISYTEVSSTLNIPDKFKRVQSRTFAAGIENKYKPYDQNGNSTNFEKSSTENEKEVNETIVTENARVHVDKALLKKSLEEIYCNKVKDVDKNLTEKLDTVYDSVVADQEISEHITKNVHNNPDNETFDKTHASLYEPKYLGEKEIIDSIFISENKSENVEISVICDDISKGTKTSTSIKETNNENIKVAFGDNSSNKSITSDQSNNTELEIANLDNNLDVVLSESETRDKDVESNFKEITDDEREINGNLHLEDKTILNEKDQDTGEINSDIAISLESEKFNSEPEQTDKSIEVKNIFVSKIETNLREPTTDDSQRNVSKDLENDTQNVLEKEKGTRIEDNKSCDEAQNKQHVEFEKDLNKPVDVVLSEEGSCVMIEVRPDEDVNILTKAIVVGNQCEPSLSNDQVYLDNITNEKANQEMIPKRLNEAIEVENQCEPPLSNDQVSLEVVAEETNQEVIPKMLNEAIEVENQCGPTLSNDQVPLENVANGGANRETIPKRLNEAIEVGNPCKPMPSNDTVSLENATEEASQEMIRKRFNVAIEVENQCESTLSNNIVCLENVTEEPNQKMIPKRLNEAIDIENQCEPPLSNDQVSLEIVAEETNQKIIPKRLNEAADIENHCEPLLSNSQVSLEIVTEETNQEMIPKRLNEDIDIENQCEPLLSNDQVSLEIVAEETNQEMIPKRLNETIEVDNQCEPTLSNDTLSLANVAEESNQEIIRKRFNEAVEVENQCEPPLSNDQASLSLEIVAEETNKEMTPKRLNETIEVDNQYQSTLSNDTMSLENVAEEPNLEMMHNRFNEAIEVETQCESTLSNDIVCLENVVEEANQEIILKRLNEAIEVENQCEPPLSNDQVSLEIVTKETNQEMIPKRLNEIIEVDNQCESLSNDEVYLENVANEEAENEMIPEILSEAIKVENQCERIASNNQVSEEAEHETIPKRLNEAIEVEHQCEALLSNDQMPLQNVANQIMFPKRLIEDISDEDTELNKDLNIQKEEIVTEIEILESTQQIHHLDILTSNDTAKKFEEVDANPSILEEIGTEILVADNTNMFSEKIVTKLEQYENPNEPTRLHLLANAAAELPRPDLSNKKKNKKTEEKVNPITSDIEKCIAESSQVKQPDDNSLLKCKPHDFVLHNHSEVPTPANNIYYTQKLLESSLITEDSNDSEGNLFIDEGNDIKNNKTAKDISEESAKKISEEVGKDNLIIKELIYYNETDLEENICKSKVKDTVLLSIPDNDQENFDFLKQFEEMEPSDNLSDKKETNKEKDDAHKNKNYNTNNKDSPESDSCVNNNVDAYKINNNTALRDDRPDICKETQQLNNVYLETSNYKRFKTKAEIKDFDKIVLKPYVSIERLDHNFKDTDNEKYKQARSKSLDLGIIMNSKTNTTENNISEVESMSSRKTTSDIDNKSDAKILKFSNKLLEHVPTQLTNSNVIEAPLSKLERKLEGNIMDDVIDTSDVDDIPLLKRTQIGGKQKISRKSEPKIVCEQKPVKTKKKIKSQKKQLTERKNVRMKRKSNNTTSIITRLTGKSGDVTKPEENVSPSLFDTKISKTPSATNLASKSRSNSRNVSEAINNEGTVKSSKVKKTPKENYTKEIKLANSTPVKAEKDSLNQRDNLKHLNKNEKIKKENIRMRQKSNNTDSVIRNLGSKSGDVEKLEENISPCIFDSKKSSVSHALTSASKNESNTRYITEAINNEGTVNSSKLKKQPIQNYTKEIKPENSTPVSAEHSFLNQRDNIKHLDKNYYITPKLRRKSMSMNRLSRLEQDIGDVKLEHVTVNVAVSNGFDISADKKYYTPPKLRRKSKVENNISTDNTSFSKKKQPKHAGVKVDILTRCKNTVSPTTEKLKKKLETDSKFIQKVISDNDSGNVNNFSTATIEDAALDVIFKAEAIKTNSPHKESKYNEYKNNFEDKEQTVNSCYINQDNVFVHSNFNIHTTLTDKNICNDSKAIYLSHIERDEINRETFKEADIINGTHIKTKTIHIAEANEDRGDKQDRIDIFTKNDKKSKDNYENMSGNTDNEPEYANSSHLSNDLPDVSKTKGELNILLNKFIKQVQLDTKSSSCSTLASKLKNVTSQEDNLKLVEQGKNQDPKENISAALHSENYTKQIESHLYFGQTHENNESFKKQELEHNLDNKIQEFDLEQPSSNNKLRKKSIADNEDSNDLDNIPLSERTLKSKALENEIIQLQRNTKLAIRKKRTARRGSYTERNVSMETKRQKREIHSESHVDQENAINNISSKTVPITLHEKTTNKKLKASSIRKSEVLNNKNKTSSSQTNIISKLTKNTIIKNEVEKLEKPKSTKQSLDIKEDKQTEVEIHSLRKPRGKNEMVKELGLSSNRQLNESRSIEEISQMKGSKKKKEIKSKEDEDRDKKKAKRLPKGCELSEEDNTDDDNSKTVLLKSSPRCISRRSDLLTPSKNTLPGRGRDSIKKCRKGNSLSHSTSPHISSLIHTTSESDLSDCNFDKYANKMHYNKSKSITCTQPRMDSSDHEKKGSSKKKHTLPDTSCKYNKSKLKIGSPSKAASSSLGEKSSKKKDLIYANTLSLPVDRGKCKTYNANQSKSTKQKEQLVNEMNYTIGRNRNVKCDETKINLKDNVQNVSKQELIIEEKICNKDNKTVAVNKNGEPVGKEDNVIMAEKLGDVIKNYNLEGCEKIIDSEESCSKQCIVKEPILFKKQKQHTPSESLEVKIVNDNNSSTIFPEPTQISETIVLDGIKQANDISLKSDENIEVCATLENNPNVNINIEKCRNYSVEGTRPEEVENKLGNNIYNSQEIYESPNSQEQPNTSKQNLKIISEEARTPSCNNIDSNKGIEYECKEELLEEDSSHLKNIVNVNEDVLQQNEVVSNFVNVHEHIVTKELSINLTCNEAVISFSQDSTPVVNKIESEIVSEDSDDLEQELFKSETNEVITANDLQKKVEATVNNNGQSEHRVVEAKESSANSISSDILKDISQDMSFSDNVIVNKIGSDEECNRIVSEKIYNLNNDEIPALDDLQKEKNEYFEHKTTKRETTDCYNRQSEHRVAETKESSSNSISNSLLKDISLGEQTTINKADSDNEDNINISENTSNLNNDEIPTSGDLLEEKVEHLEHRTTEREITVNDNGQSEHRIAETKEPSSNSTSGGVLKDISQDISSSDNVTMDKIGSDDECNRSLSEKTCNLNIDEIPTLGDLQEYKMEDFGKRNIERETMDNDNRQSEDRVAEAKASSSNSGSSGVLNGISQDTFFGDNVMVEKNKIGSDDECNKSISEKTSNLINDQIPNLGDLQEEKHEGFVHGATNLNINRIFTKLGTLQEKKNENFEHKPNEYIVIKAKDSCANSISSDIVKPEHQGSISFDDDIIINERNHDEVYNDNLTGKEMFEKYENFDQISNENSVKETRGSSTNCRNSDVIKSTSQDNRSSSNKIENNKEVIAENLLGSETKLSDSSVISALADLQEIKDVPDTDKKNEDNATEAEELSTNCESSDEIKNVPQDKISFDNTESNKVTEDGWSENNFGYKETILRNVIITEDLQTTDAVSDNCQHNEVETKELSIKDTRLSGKETFKEYLLESKEHKPDVELYDGSKVQGDLTKEESSISSLTEDKDYVLLANRKRKNVTFEDATLIEKDSSISKSDLLAKKTRLDENNIHVQSLKNKSDKNNVKQQCSRKGEKRSIESIISHLKEEQGNCKVSNEETALTPHNLSLDSVIDINNVDVSMLRKKLLRKMKIPDQYSTSTVPEVIKNKGSVLRKSQRNNAMKHSTNEESLLQNKLNDTSCKTSYSNSNDIKYICLDAAAETSDTLKDVSSLSTTLTKEIISDNNLTAPSSVFVNDNLHVGSTKDVKNFQNVESNECPVNPTETTFLKNSVDICSKAAKGREGSLESFAKELPTKSSEDAGLINFSELMINGTSMDKITVFPEDVCMFSIESLSMVQTSTTNNFMSVDNNIDITCLGEPDDRKFNLGPVGGPLFSGTLEENNFLQTSFNKPLDESKPPVEFPLHDNQPEELEFSENNFRGIMPDDTYISGGQASSDTNAFPLSNYDLADIERMNLMECSISTSTAENRIVSSGIKSSIDEPRGTNNDMNPWAQFKANENPDHKVVVLSNEQCITPTLLMTQNDLVQSFTDEIIETASTPTSVTTNEIPAHTLLESKKSDQKAQVLSNDQCITPTLPVSQNDLVRSFNTGIVSSPKCTVLDDILPKYSRSVPWRKKRPTSSIDEKSLINPIEKINSPGGKPTGKIIEGQNLIEQNAGKQQKYSEDTIENKSKIDEISLSKESDVQPAVNLEKLGRRAATKKYSSSHIKEAAIKSDTLKCTTDNVIPKNTAAEAKPNSQFTKTDLESYPQNTLKPSNGEANYNSFKMYSKNNGSPKSNIPSNKPTQPLQSTSNYSINYILSNEPTLNINSVNEKSAKDCRQSKNRGIKRKLSSTKDEEAIGKQDNKKQTKDYGRPDQSNSNKDSLFDQLREQGNVNKLISLRVTEDNKLKTERGACSLEQKSCKEKEQRENEKLLKQGNVNKVISPGVMEDGRLKTERRTTNSNVEKSYKYREQIENDNLRPRKSSSRISKNEEPLTSHITSNQRGKVGFVNQHNKGRDGYQSDRRGRDGYQSDRRGRDGYHSDRRGRDGYQSDHRRRESYQSGRRGRDDHNFDIGVTDSFRFDHTKEREGHYVGGSSRPREGHSEHIRGRGQPRSTNVASAYYSVSTPQPSTSQSMDHSHQKNGPFMKSNTKISNEKLDELLNSIEPKSRDNLGSSSHKRGDEEEYSWIEKFNQRIKDSDLLAPLNRQIFSKTSSRKDK